MRKISVVLILMVLAMAFAGIAMAADSTANVSVLWQTPTGVTEIQPYSITFNRRAGGGVSGSTTVSNLLLSDFWEIFFASMPAVTAGCFKITGNPNTAVLVTVTLPANIGPMTIDNGLPYGVAGQNCVSGQTSGSGTRRLNAGASFNVGSSGELYITWIINSYTNYPADLVIGNGTPPHFYASFSNLEVQTLSGTATVTVNYY